MAKKILSMGVLVFLGMAMVGVAFAQETVPPRFGGIPATATSGADFVKAVEGVTDWLFVILLLGAVFFLVLAGWQFITGGGDPQSIAQARNKVFYAVIGILVAALSKGLVFAIKNIVGKS